MNVKRTVNNNENPQTSLNEYSCRSISRNIHNNNNSNSSINLYNKHINRNVIFNKPLNNN